MALVGKVGFHTLRRWVGITRKSPEQRAAAYSFSNVCDLIDSAVRANSTDAPVGQSPEETLRASAMANELFEVFEEQSVQCMKLMLPDQLDHMVIDRLIDDALQSLVAKKSGKWVLDLTEVSYMGSAMLGLMVNIRERIRQGGGKLVLCGLSPDLMKIFQTCCLERLFAIAKTRADAIGQLTRR
jgi:anti-anti-sigma factor